MMLHRGHHLAVKLDRRIKPYILSFFGHEAVQWLINSQLSCIKEGILVYREQEFFVELSRCVENRI